MVHDVLDVLIHDVHSFFFSHETFDGLLVVLAFHFVGGAVHYLAHVGHDVLHRIVDDHLLESKNRVKKGWLLEVHVLELGV